jgi:hypothetical protein
VSFRCYEREPTLKTTTLIISVGLFVLQGVIFTFSAQEAPPSENKWQPSFSADGTTVTVDSWTAENLWMRKRGAAALKNSDFWRFFMHGFRDHKATPIAWRQLFADEKDAEAWIDPTQTLNNTVKNSTFPALLLEGQKTLVLPKPVLDIPALATLKGRTLRFFIWLKGENCGQDRTLWDGAPSLTLSLKDSLNNLIITESSLFKTRGTFPWFCYHLEIEIPTLLNTTLIEKKAETAEEAGGAPLDLNLMVAMLDPAQAAIPRLPDGGGLYMTLSNLGGGKAWFSTLSWEIADKANSLPQSEWADPVTGSRAPNPDYDEFPMHLFFGIEPEKSWTFLTGNRVYKDLTTINGLEQYLKFAAKDWFHMQYGVAKLGYLQATIAVLKQASTFESGWREALCKQLLALQNPTTGLWGAGGTDNLMVTHAIVTNCFSPKTLPRSDRAQEETPWLNVSKNGLPNIGALLNSLLGARLKDPASGKLKAWNRFAFQPEYLGAGQRDKVCDLGATSAAVQILAQIAAQTIISSEKEMALNAIRDAWEYSMTNFVTPNYLWKQDDLSLSVTSPAFMMPLLEATQWLEPRISKDLSAPATEATELPGNKYRVRWNDKKTSFVSLRIYAVPAETAPEKLTEKHLVAILNRSNRSPLTADPLCGLQTFAATAQRRWGITPQSEGADYIAEKLAAIPKDLTLAEGGAEIIFPIPQILENETPIPLKYYLSAVTAYGEMTPPKQIFE